MPHVVLSSTSCRSNNPAD